MPELSTVGALTAFGAGIVSFLSPCVLPLVPGYVSYIAGDTLGADQRAGRRRRGRLTVLSLSIFFVLGFSSVFIALGASATMLGRLLLAYRYEANIVGGAIVIAFGLVMTGLLRMPVLGRQFRFHADSKGGRPLAAYVLGLAFGFGWTPCIGPVLGAVLTASAVSATLAQGDRAPRVLLTRARRSVPGGGRLHRRLPRPHQVGAPGRGAAADRGRRDDGPDGDRHDHRQALGLRLLAAQYLPGAGRDRLASAIRIGRSSSSGIARGAPRRLAGCPARPRRSGPYGPLP